MVKGLLINFLIQIYYIFIKKEKKIRFYTVSFFVDLLITTALMYRKNISR